MSVEENKAIVRRIYEEFKRRNLPAYYELHATDYVFHLPGGVEVRGLERLKQTITMVLSAFPDYHEAVEDMVAEGDMVVVRHTLTGTHKGEWLGIAATGKKVTWTAIAILRIVGGKLVEAWAEIDMLGVMQQLGAIPTPGQG